MTTIKLSNGIGFITPIDSDGNEKESVVNESGELEAGFFVIETEGSGDGKRIAESILHYKLASKLKKVSKMLVSWETLATIKRDCGSGVEFYEDTTTLWGVPIEVDEAIPNGVVRFIGGGES